jgi:hypothetical protein
MHLERYLLVIFKHLNGEDFLQWLEDVMVLIVVIAIAYQIFGRLHEMLSLRR